jgi:hypothetical protein
MKRNAGIAGGVVVCVWFATVVVVSYLFGNEMAERVFMIPLGVFAFIGFVWYVAGGYKSV